MKPVVLFRCDGTEEHLEERAAAKAYFDVVRLRTEVPPGSLVIPRYATLPEGVHHRELEADLKNLCVSNLLLNSTYEHDWIANFDWCWALEEHFGKGVATPRSWTLEQFPYAFDAKPPFVVKGRTKGRKDRFGTHMYAGDRVAVSEVSAELALDPMVGPQGLVVREYAPLKTFEHDLGGCPISNEWRTFWLRDRMLCAGYYWSCASDRAKSQASFGAEALDFAQGIADYVAKHATGFVLDVAEKADGGWTLVEVNDLTCAGLSDCDADQFYRELLEALREEKITT
jgi:hypothetical protein